MTERQHATWGELLQGAVEKPGRLLEAYTAFYNFSFGNALLASSGAFAATYSLDHSTPIAGG